MKISLCIPIWNRRELLLRCKERIHQIEPNANIEYSIFEDLTPGIKRIEKEDLLPFSSVIEYGVQRETPTFPVEQMNRAVANSTGSVVCWQSGEVYPLMQVYSEISLIASQWKKDEHHLLVAPCIHLDEEMTKKLLAGELNLEDDLSQVEGCKEFSASYQIPVYKMRWSAHPTYAPKPWSQLIAMPRKTWEALDGYSLAYSGGPSYADDDLLMKAWALGVKLKWLYSPVIHLYHGEFYLTDEMMELGTRNRNIFEEKWKMKIFDIERLYQERKLGVQGGY